MADYERGRVELGGRCHAYLQPDGGWGWSNAGLVVGEGRSLLVDTLFDLRLTAAMLDELAPLTGPNPIGTVVNTHANGDHCYGNELVADAEIVATEACAEEMGATPPAMLAAFKTAGAAGELGAAGEYFARVFEPFEFEGITLTPPDRTFSGELELDVAGTAVQLIELGPAHTAGDAIAWVPSERTVFTGDLLFIEGTPLMWAGPLANWVAACDRILALEPEFIVPGHGPLTDAAGVRLVRDYLTFVDAEARKRFAEGMDAATAARDIALGEFAGWIDAERIAVNVDTVYRELDPSRPPTDVVTLFDLMATAAV